MALYGILGDIHGNREALAAVLAALERHRPERLLCVGDIVGYNADPDDCVTLLRERGVIAIAGNHELISTGRLGFERCSNEAMHSLKLTRRQIRPNTAEYLRSLPAALQVDGRVVLVHGGVRDAQQYMTKPHHIKENLRYLRADFPGCRICFYGHIHEQKLFEIGDDGVVRDLPVQEIVKLRSDLEYFVNAGSLDASRKHDHKLAEFALFDSGALTVEFFRIPYNDRLTEAKAAAAGYRIGPWRSGFYTLQRKGFAKLRSSLRGKRLAP